MTNYTAERLPSCQSDMTVLQMAVRLFILTCLMLAITIPAEAKDSSLPDCSDLLAMNELPVLTDDQFSPRRVTHDLCRFEDWGVTIRSGRHRSDITLLAGDMSQILNIFPDDPNMRQGFYDVSIMLVPEEPSVWRVRFVDQQGEAVPVLSDYYVWSREYSVLLRQEMRRAGKTRDPSRNQDFSPARLIRCNFVEEGNGCVTYLNTPDCNDPLELKGDLLPGKPPRFIAGLDNDHPRTDMLSNMEDIFAIMERYARVAMFMECTEERLQ